MKVCVIHNAYEKFSGEERVVAQIGELLTAHGHELIGISRSSADIDRIRFGKIRALLSGIYNPFSRQTIFRVLKEQNPDIVHIHNLYPFFSPAILPICRQAGKPVVMTVHNYRLICPSGLFYSHGAVCERCRGGREIFCVLRNCENSRMKSVGYALRNYMARIRHYYLDNVTVFACLTDFQRRILVAEGFPKERTVVIPNMTDGQALGSDGSDGKYVGFVGRISQEKGVDLLMAAARRMPAIQFKAAGAYARMPALVACSPTNFQFLGPIAHSETAAFMANARVIVLCSRWYEGFPMTLVEAMIQGTPVVCPTIGGLADIVDDGVTGLLFEPGSVDDLSRKIQRLWGDPSLCRQMGNAAREKALREYSSEHYYERLICVYRKAVQVGTPSHTAAIGANH